MFKPVNTALLAAAVLAFTTSAALAQTAPSSMAPNAMAKPSCAAGDPMVGVNMNTKMYMTAAQMQAKSAGLTPDQKQAMMKKNNVQMMCKSKADAMGAKMMAAPAHAM